MEHIYLLLHLGFLAVAGVGIMLADRLAFSWMRGRTDTVHPKQLLRLHWIVTIALAGLLITGLLMFWPMRVFLMSEPQFWLKMSLVGVLLINSFFIEIFMHTSTTHPFRSLTFAQKAPLFVSGGVSVACWLGAATLAFFLLP